MLPLFVIFALLIVTTNLILFKILRQKYKSEYENFAFKYNLLLEDKQKLAAELSKLNDSSNILSKENTDLKLNNIILEERLKNCREVIDGYKNSQDIAIEQAKKAIFEVGNQLSSKLIEDHRRETEVANKESLNRFQESTNKFNDDFAKIISKVSSLNDQVIDSKKSLDVLNRALTNPTGAGNLAEITLENILKKSGLIHKQDYMLQYNLFSVEDQVKLRPDAIIFLPSNNLLIIDSKASKFFVDLARAENTEDIKKYTDKIKQSMRLHLKSLVNKSYQDNIKQSLKTSGYNDEIRMISTIMFLPSETIIEKLQEIDPDFLLDAWEVGIYPAGPIGLVNILIHAKFQICEYTQTKNFEAILDELKSLISGITNLHTYAQKLGNSIYTSSGHFDKFAKIFNNNILSKAKNLLALGIKPKHNKSLPNSLELHQSGNEEHLEN